MVIGELYIFIALFRFVFISISKHTAQFDLEVSNKTIPERFTVHVLLRYQSKVMCAAGLL